MQIDSSINSLLKLEKQLEQSTQKLAKLNKDTKDSTTNEQTNTKNHSNTSDNESFDEQPKEQTYSQPKTPMPLGYGIDNNKVSVFNTAHQTLLDIKA